MAHHHKSTDATECDGEQVLACAIVKPLGRGCDSEVVSEVAAFCVHPEYRGSGRGDSLLAYLGTLLALLQSVHSQKCLSPFKLHSLFGVYVAWYNPVGKSKLRMFICISHRCVENDVKATVSNIACFCEVRATSM